MTVQPTLTSGVPIRHLSVGLIAIASLSLASCGQLGFPVTTGGLKLTLAPATVTGCQSVVLEDPYLKNTSLKGRSSVEVRNEAVPGTGVVGRYPNPTDKKVVLDSAGEYTFFYVIQYPQYPEKLSLTFHCTKSGTASTQDFTITGTSGEQTVNLSF